MEFRTFNKTKSNNMKKNYSFLKRLIVIICFTLSGKLFSQTVNVPYQFYHDVNNNCVYDTGDTILYNIPGYATINYINTSSVSASSFVGNACGDLLSIINPSVPANNNLSLSASQINTACACFTNLSYTSTNYIPIKNISQMVNVMFFSSIGNSIGNVTNNVFPVCFNLGPDSARLSFLFYNLFTCNSTMASRTYSLFLDGVLFDQLTTSGTSYNIVTGSKSTILEGYTSPNAAFITFRTVFPSNIATLGSHVFLVKSTNIYNNSLAAINYSCTLNSVPCSKISGQFYNDCNSNCIKDGGDVTLSGGVKVVVNTGSANYSILPDNTGAFSCYLASSNPSSLTSFSTSPSCTPCPASTSTIIIPPGIITNTITMGYKNNNYGFDPAPILAGSSFPFFPATNYTLALKVYFSSASGCTTPTVSNPGKVKFFLDKNFIYQNAAGTTPVPNIIVPGPGGDTLIWNISNFYTSIINYSFVATVPSTVSIGAVFAFAGIITPTSDDDFSNNIFNTGPHWIGSPLDPNGKECYAQGIQPNGDIPYGVQDLYYTIRFQNIGTAPAIDVTTIDTLDSNLDWSTLQVINSSFPVQTQVDFGSGQTFFYFPRIFLPDSTTNEPGSHGYVYYKIKLKSGVPVNTIIKNRAHNYFDFNAPVPTNQTKNKLVNLAGIKEIELANSIKLLPNPVNDKLFISCEEVIREITVSNSLGQLLVKQELNEKQGSLDMTALPRGFYLVSITLNSNQIITKKVIKD